MALAAQTWMPRCDSGPGTKLVSADVSPISMGQEADASLLLVTQPGALVGLQARGSESFPFALGRPGRLHDCAAQFEPEPPSH
jgi:hypothetical protein